VLLRDGMLLAHYLRSVRGMLLTRAARRRLLDLCENRLIPEVRDVLTERGTGVAVAQMVSETINPTVPGRRKTIASGTTK
jgi:hypothetical protein